MTTGDTKIVVCWCLHDDHWYFPLSAASFGELPKLALVSRLAWNGSKGDWQKMKTIAEECGVRIIVGDWDDEQLHRRAALQLLQEEGWEYALIADGDEVVSPELLKTLLSLADSSIVDRVHVQMDTYWKSPDFVIRPRERLEPLFMVRPEAVEQVYIREYKGGTKLTLDASCGVIHHLSYCGPDERIERKLATWGHRHEVMRDWYQKVWRAWDADPVRKDLHPTHPTAFGFAERILVPEVLGKTRKMVESGRPIDWPSISIVIPVYNQHEDVKLCLDSIAKCLDLVSETIVVDNGSGDETKGLLETYEWLTLLQNEQNLGFAAASNQGVEAATGNVVIFLNSDTVVPRAGLLALIKSLMKSGSVGAVGPLTNQAGYYQRIAPTYTSLETLDLFAEHWASLPFTDADVEMLVGFCLAVKKTVLDEIGSFDETFGLGLFEDTDLCYRIQRAGYRLCLAQKAYVHHTGSKTLTKVVKKPESLLEGNEQKFLNKWRQDVDSGFASHLPGGPSPLGPVKFDRTKDPMSPESEVSRLRELAGVSLCMIVKNEERVLRECLRSTKPFFKETIIVDTGSTDATVQIARDEGATVIESAWPDSFSEARNVSLGHATGKWIFWIDADDTLPWHTGIKVLQAAVDAPADVAGFVVPVQFVDDLPEGGTRVDHVKLFRNLPEVRFEGRIHEQVLPSLRPIGEIVRLDSVVLHSGYDTSASGQANKRERDWHLLKLDLEERPDHPFVLFNIGMTHHFCGDHEEAIEWFTRCLEHSLPHESHVRKVYALMGMSYKMAHDNDKAREVFEKGLEVCGEDPELRFYLAMHFAESGDFARARDEYENVRNNLDSHFSSVDIGILGYKRDFNLGQVYLGLGEYGPAKECFLSAIKSSPKFVDGAVVLFYESLKQGDWLVANQTAAHVRAVEPGSVRSAEIDWGLAEAVSGSQAAEAACRAAVVANPSQTGPALALARKLLRSGREGEALPFLELLDRLGVGEAAYYLGVAHVKAGQFEDGLSWMKRARDLDPDHEDTITQIQAIEHHLAGN